MNHVYNTVNKGNETVWIFETLKWRLRIYHGVLVNRFSIETYIFSRRPNAFIL